MALSDLTEPARLDLKLVAGDSFRRSIVLKSSDGTPIDLTGLTARAQIRDRPAGKLLADITTTVDAPTTGEIVLTLTTVQTRALNSHGVWDLELDGGVSNTHTIVGGEVRVLPDVTVA